jgi:catechol 2,3-dioxygenase-like lactoylglutathione lyase family enzyme
MFSHVMLGASDLEKSRRFYDALLGALGIAPGVANKNRYFYRAEKGPSFGISTPINGEPACYGNGATTGFSASSPAQADAAHAAGVAAGGTDCEDPPGWRGEQGAGGMYLAYLRDPDGNKICLLHRPPKAA